MVQDQQLRQKISASSGTILNFAFWYILPFSYNIAPLLLPFAIGNGLCAGAAYACLDVASGGVNSNIIRNPLITGGGIGALTGVVAPTFVYGNVYSVLYGIEGMSETIRQCFQVIPFGLQICGATGFVAGMALYPILHYPISGVKNMHWVNFSGLLLLASTVTMYHLYASDGEKVMPILQNGSYVTPKEKSSLNSVIRYNLTKSTFETYSISSNSWIGPPELYHKGKMTSDAVRLYNNNLPGQNITYDDQVLAFLSRWMDGRISERYHERIVQLMDPKDLKRCQLQLLKTDSVVYNIIHRKKSESSTLTSILDQFCIDGNCLSKGEKNRWIKNIDIISNAVEALVALRAVDKKNQANGALQKEVDLWVRKRCPDAILLKEDENDHDGSLGQSIESQLSNANWTLDLNDAIVHWNGIRQSERRELQMKRIMIFFGVVLSFASVLVSS